MIAFPPAKINLGLRVLRKRDDGFHDLQTIFLAIPLCDILELVPNTETTSGSMPLFSNSGLAVDGPPEQNICLLAYQLLKRDFSSIPSVRMHLHKVIPMGAGMGGGSSDGAHTLRMLNQLAGLGLTVKQLEAYALELGSDCPFFIQGKPCYAEGRGERMVPVQVDLRGYTLVLINPGIHVSTAAAFRGIQPRQPERSLLDIVRQPVSSWKGAMINDFEETIFPQFPAIAELRTLLYDAGAAYAAMSGSGSTVFGLFQHGDPALPPLPATYTVVIRGL